jgi:hypothetical protein
MMKTKLNGFRPGVLLLLLWIGIAATGFTSCGGGDDNPKGNTQNDTVPDEAPSQDTPSDSWRQLPIRSEQEFLENKIGGEAEQHPHSIARCRTHPDHIYFSQDVSGVWKSTDGGDTWQKCLDKGLFLPFGQSIEVDPINPDLVFVVVDNSYNWLAEDFEGLYRSLDGGDNWQHVLKVPTYYTSGAHRIFRHNIAYDPGSGQNNAARRWYVATANGALYRSEDGGDTWQTAADLNQHDIVYGVYCHPADSRHVYLATSNGLWVSTSRGEDLAAWGDLPAGAVSSLAIHPENPQVIYATVLDQGLYRSDNSGATFMRIRQFDASRVFMNPGYPDTLYLVGTGSNTVITHDGGRTWIEDMVTAPAPGLGRVGSWKGRIAGQLSGIVPNPEDSDEAVAFSRATLWKTIDGGHVFADSSTLFTGFAASWWNNTICFDRLNPNRLAFFNNDVGMTLTRNNGRYFDQRNEQAWSWYQQGLIGWFGTYAGSFQPIADSQVIVAAVGDYFRTQLMRSTDEGNTWTLVTSGDDNQAMNLFVSFHPNDPDVVYAGNKISYDAGQTFEGVDFGEFAGQLPQMLGMCHASPDTVYAMDRDRYRIQRSDNRGADWRLYAQPGWRFSMLDSLPTFAVDPNDPDKVYTIDGDGDFAVFDGTTWSGGGVLDLAGGGAQHNFVRTISVDPNDSDIVYAGTIASGHECIFRSMDGGIAWENITGNLPRNGMSAMAVNPHTGELYKGSCIGTWIYPAPY